MEEITKEEARRLLESMLIKSYSIPIYDVVIKEYNYEGEIKCYSFRELLKIVYNLKDK